MANTTGKKFGGRKLGTANKSMETLRAGINSFIGNNWKNVQKEYNSLESKDKLAFIEKLMKYAIPSLSNVSATIDYNNLSDNDLDEIIKNLKSKE